LWLLLLGYLGRLPSNAPTPAEGGFPLCFPGLWLARPEGFEPPTPRFVVWCSIGRVLDSRLIPDDGSPPRNETMRHKPDRHSPALDFKSSRLKPNAQSDTLVVA